MGEVGAVMEMITRVRIPCVVEVEAKHLVESSATCEQAKAP